MNKLVIVFFISGIFFTSINCSKHNNQDCINYNPPASLIFKFTKNGIILKDSVLKNFRISYLENGTKMYLTDVTLATGVYPDKGLLSSRLIGSISADKNIKTFLIEYSTIEYDTLSVSYLQRTPSTNCLYVLQDLKFKSKFPLEDTSFKFSTPVYILNRP